MQDAVFGALSYLVTACLVFHPWLNLPWPYRLIFDLFFWMWVFEFCYCWFTVYWLYSRGPKSPQELFRMGIWLILNAAVMTVIAHYFIDKTTSLLDAGLPQKGWLTVILSGVEILQNIIGFGLAAFGANLSATVITNRWKGRIHG